jgi:hypothetical protein
LRLIDSLPIPSIIDSTAENVSISYYPEYPAIYFAYRLDGPDYWYRLEVGLDEQKNATRKAELLQKYEGRIENTVINQNENIRLLVKTDIADPELASYYATCKIEIEGYLATVVYKNKNIDVSQMSGYDIVSGFWIDTMK